MGVKLKDVLYKSGTHTVNGITLQVSDKKEIRAYLDGELFLYSPAGMSIATRATNGNTIKLRNALNKVFEALDFPIVWTVSDGTLCFAPMRKSFTSNQELVVDTTYAYNINCVFHWDSKFVGHTVNDFLHQELKSNRYI